MLLDDVGEHVMVLIKNAYTSYSICIEIHRTWAITYISQWKEYIMSNPFGNTRKENEPYAIYAYSQGWIWKVLKTYKEKGYTKEDAITQARMAYILQKDQYNGLDEYPSMWQPPSEKLIHEPKLWRGNE